MSKSSAKRNAIVELRALFERNGYVRRQNMKRLSKEGPQRYKKGSEVRLMAKSEPELAHVRELIEVLGFTAGRPFAKGHQFCVPIYGGEQVAKFSALVGEQSTKPARRSSGRARRTGA